VLVAAAIMAMTGCGYGGESAPSATAAHVENHAPISGPALAAQAARDLLSHLVLPSGTVRTLRPPSSVNGLLSTRAPGASFGLEADRYVFWTSHQSPAAMLAFVAHRDAPGALLLNSTRQEKQGHDYYWSEEFVLPAKAPLRTRRLSVGIVRSGAHLVTVRLDARAVWRLPRPGYSLIPRGVDSVTITVAPPTKFAGHTMGSSRLRPFSSRNATTVAAVARAVNNLSVAEPTGAAFSCPAGDGELYVWLTFREAGGRQLALVQVDPYGCGRASAWMTVPGHRRLALSGSATVIRAAKASGSLLEGVPR
jgi:hypothetical protein